jgi:glycosyltransferase involved in cell wall biosynthesis
MQMISAYETLPTIAKHLKDTLLVVPGEILDRFSYYQLSLLEEDLGRNRCCLQGAVPGTNPPQEITLEILNQQAAALRQKLAQRADGYRRDARWLHLKNMIRGVALRKRIAYVRRQPRASGIKTMVFINSQVLAGSEAYGLQVNKALANIGFDIETCAPASFDPYPEGINNLNKWLKSRGLRPMVKAEYGQVSRSIFLPVLPEQALQHYAEDLRKWLDAREIGLVFCSGFISEPVICGSEERLVYMGLFQPWDYCLRRMGYLRSRVMGVCSDTQWAADQWARWMSPPVICVPSMVEIENSAIRNHNLSPDPIRIALAGTLQPRKRQKEAVQAVRNLLQEGWDLRLNFYGYEFSGFSQYIQEVKALAAEPVFEGRITFNGFLEDFSEIPRNNHIILSSSSDESLPQVLLFTMAAGLVAVACPAGGIPEIVWDRKTGFLAKGFAVEDITEVLRRALTARDRWPEVISQARQLIRDRCSEQIFTHRLLGMMHQGADIWLSPGRNFFAGSRFPGELTWLPQKHRCDSADETTYLDINHMVIGPEIGSKPLQYSILAERDKLTGFHFQVGTFCTQPKGKLCLRVILREDGNLLRRVEMDLAKAKDNGWLRIEFAPIMNSRHKRFIVSVTAEVVEGRLAIYEKAPPRPGWLYDYSLRMQRRMRTSIPLTFLRSLPAFISFYQV